jgi:hypothetical protein
MTLNRPVSISSVSVFQNCPAKYWFKYYSGIRLEEVEYEYQQRGTLVHEGIAAALRYGDEKSNYEIATVAVLEYANARGINQTVIDDALEMLEYYMPAIGINRTVFVYEHNGVSLVEYQFEETIEDTTIRGTIDAVVKHVDGRILVLDFKCKKELYDTSAVMMDAQLYVYVFILRNIMKIPVDGAMQVQMWTQVPGKVKYNKDGNVSKVISKTTQAIVDSMLEQLPQEERIAAMMTYAGKIAPETDFLRYSKIDMSLVDNMFGIFMLRARDIDKTEIFLPVQSAFLCKDCGYLNACYAKIKGKL